MPGFTYPSAIPTLTVGGRVFTDLANLIQLYSIGSGTANVNCTFRKPNTSAGYVVPASKTFRMLAWEYADNDTVGTEAILIGYADNDVGFGTNTAFTNRVTMVGSTSGYRWIRQTTRSTFIPQGAINFTIPTGKYPNISFETSLANTRAVTVWGYEE